MNTQQEQFDKEPGLTPDAPLDRLHRADAPVELPQCCGTGCAVCVLDYPELFSQSPANAETLALLEAVEQAQLEADRLFAESDGDL